MDFVAERKQPKGRKTIPFRSHAVSFSSGNVLCREENIRWWGWRENKCVDPFLCSLQMRRIGSEMCWILAFAIPSIFAQFSHYLNVHFCAIFYTLVFGFCPTSLFCLRATLFAKVWKINPKIYRIVSSVTEWNWQANKWVGETKANKQSSERLEQWNGNPRGKWWKFVSGWLFVKIDWKFSRLSLAIWTFWVRNLIIKEV